MVRTGFEPATYGFQIRRSNHSATLPPQRSAHYIEDSFEEQSVISEISGLKYFETNAVPTTFKNGPPHTKKLKQHDKNISHDAVVPYHQNKHRSHYELIGLIENEKLLRYVKEEIKACVNQFKVRKTPSEN